MSVPNDFASLSEKEKEQQLTSLAERMRAMQVRGEDISILREEYMEKGNIFFSQKYGSSYSNTMQEMQSDIETKLDIVKNGQKELVITDANYETMMAEIREKGVSSFYDSMIGPTNGHSEVKLVDGIPVEISTNRHVYSHSQMTNLIREASRKDLKTDENITSNYNMLLVISYKKSTSEIEGESRTLFITFDNKKVIYNSADDSYYSPSDDSFCDHGKGVIIKTNNDIMVNLSNPARKTIIDKYRCSHCQELQTADNRFKKCSICHAQYYCSVKCQRADWDEHKKGHK